MHLFIGTMLQLVGSVRALLFQNALSTVIKEWPSETYDLKLKLL